MNFRYQIILICIIFIAPGISGQTFHDLIENYNYFNEHNLVEQLSIHTDRDLYLAGETIFISISGVETRRISGSHLSDIISIELFNGQNGIVSQQRIHATGLRTTCEIYIPPESESGFYILQVYTSWNKNFGPSVNALKHIKVINTRYPRAITSFENNFKTKPWYEIAIFPACKNIIAGMVNEVVVKAFNKFLKPEPGRGLIYNELYDSITSFYIDSTGLGSFYLLPEPGREYFLQYVSSSQDTIYDAIPEAIEGIIMIPEIIKGNFQMSFEYSPGFVLKDPLHLLIIKGLQIVDRTDNLDKNRQLTYNPTEQYTPGFYTAYLVTQDLEEISSRNFIVYDSPKTISPVLDRTEYGTRDKVSVNVRVPDASINQAIYEITVLKDHDILGRNALWSWAENTDYHPYLSPEWMNITIPDTVSLQKVLDWMVVTVRTVIHYSELNAIYQSDLNFPPEFRGEIVSGQIRQKSDNSPVSDQLVGMGLKGKKVQFYNTLTNPDGQFYVLVKGINEVQPVTISCIPPDDSKSIFIDNQYQGNHSPDTLPPVLLDAGRRDELEDLYQTLLIRDSYPSFAPEIKAENRHTMKDFYGEPDFVLSMDKYVRLPVMEEVFFEIVRNVIISRSKGETHLLVVDENTKKVIGDSPLILIDGVPYFDSKYALQLNPENIESIRVVFSKYYFGHISFDGIIDIRTNSAGGNGHDLPPGAMNLDYNFMTQPVYSGFPCYPATEDKQSRIPDYRNLLYWDPDIPGGETVTFYTSDQPGQYKVIVKEIIEGKVTGIGSTLLNVK